MMKNTIILSICLSICQSHILAQIHTSKADTLDLTSRIFDLSPIVVTRSLLSDAGLRGDAGVQGAFAPVQVISFSDFFEDLSARTRILWR